MSGRRNSGRRPSRSNSHSSRRSHYHRHPSNGGVHPAEPANHLAALEALNARMSDNPAQGQPGRRPRRQSRGFNPNAGEAGAAAAAAAVTRNQTVAPVTRDPSQRSNRSHRIHREERAEQPAEHRDFEADLPNAVPKAYDVRDLARLLRANAATAPARFAARLDITQQGIVRGNAPNNLASDATAEIREYLEAWVGVLDTVFFFGSLIRKNLEGGFSLYHKPGSLRQGFYDPERKNVRINTWDPSAEDPERDPAWFAEQLVCVLFHTMLTVFFDLLGCACSECIKSNAPQKGGMGAGHGPPFINALAPMQEALGQEVPWHVDCRVRESLEMEMQQSKWKPSAEQFAMFGDPDVARPERSANPPNRLPVDNDDDHNHYRRTGVQRRHPKDENKCCVIL